MEVIITQILIGLLIRQEEELQEQNMFVQVVLQEVVMEQQQDHLVHIHVQVIMVSRMVDLVELNHRLVATTLDHQLTILDLLAQEVMSIEVAVVQAQVLLVEVHIPVEVALVDLVVDHQVVEVDLIDNKFKNRSL